MFETKDNNDRKEVHVIAKALETMLKQSFPNQKIIKEINKENQYKDYEVSLMIKQGEKVDAGFIHLAVSTNRILVDVDFRGGSFRQEQALKQSFINRDLHNMSVTSFICGRRDVIGSFDLKDKVNESSGLQSAVALSKVMETILVIANVTKQKLARQYKNASRKKPLRQKNHLSLVR